jgi:predicted CXXCH cytochrome family protein
VRRGAVGTGCALAAVAAGALLFACGETPAPSTGDVARRTWESFYRPSKERIPSALATNPGTPWGDYVGSVACKACHAKEHADWRESFHSRTLYDVDARTVFGDFTGKTTFRDARFAYTVTPLLLAGTWWMRVEANAESKETPDTYGGGIPRTPVGEFRVLYAFGNRRHQAYVVKDAEGRHWVPPVYWNDVSKAWTWDGWRPYVRSCAPCHVTGIKSLASEAPGSMPLDHTRPQRWTPPPASEGWAEGAVGCETCHGPGRAHVAAVKAAGEAGYRAKRAAGAEPTIYCPSRDTKEARASQCASCHDFFHEAAVTWVPGPKGYDHEMLAAPIGPASRGPIDPKQFYGDGTDMSPCTIGRVFGESRMGRKGVECADCHVPHGNATFGSLKAPLAGNALCLSCHEHADAYGTKEALERHTRHAAGSPGSSCVECHMPRDKHFTNGVEVMEQGLHSHAFTVPRGDPKPGAPPSSCLVCHRDRDALWVRRTLEAWSLSSPPPK